MTFLAAWTVSMTAMMLPGTLPLLRLDYAVARSRSRRRTALVAAGYVAVWSALGVVALPLDGLLMDRGRWVAVAALAAAAAYQLSPLKRRCLARCASARRAASGALAAASASRSRCSRSG